MLLIIKYSLGCEICHIWICLPLIKEIPIISLALHFYPQPLLIFLHFPTVSKATTEVIVIEVVLLCFDKVQKCNKAEAYMY